MQWRRVLTSALIPARLDGLEVVISGVAAAEDVWQTIASGRMVIESLHFDIAVVVSQWAQLVQLGHDPRSVSHALVPL